MPLQSSQYLEYSVTFKTKAVGIPADDEEMALTLNGKKKKLKKQDFVAAMAILNMEEKPQQNIFNKIEKANSKWMKQIDNSFLTDEFKIQYQQVITERFERINK